MVDRKIILHTNMLATPDDINELISHNGGLPRYFRIDTSPSKKPGQNLMRLALSDSVAKKLLVTLTNLGYVLYYDTSHESRFIRLDRIPHHWRPAKSGDVKISDDGVVYKLELPESKIAKRLVVVMSPLSSKPRLARYFRPSFSTLIKYLPPNTAVLRIGDIGGVKGAFYMDTVAIPENSVHIHNLIRNVEQRLGLADMSAVLYGASKGGSGAIYHGLSGRRRFVAVDPIVSDEWYEIHKSDYHFTAGGVFLQSKQEVFTDLVEEISRTSTARNCSSVIITSSKSPQYTYTADIIAPIAEQITVWNSGNSGIRRHPDVAPLTIYAQVMALNSLLVGTDLKGGEMAIP